MVQAVSGELRNQARYFIAPKDASPSRWRTDFLGEHGTRSGEVEDRPQAFLAELGPHSSLLPHFHQVAQFQVMLSGGGSLGGKAASLIALRYADDHTPCARLDVGPHGLSVFMFRAQADPGALHTHKPENQSRLKPTKGRYFELGGIATSTEPVLESRREIAMENLLTGIEVGDGLGVFIMRMGANMKASGPEPSVLGGQYFLVVNGALQFDRASYALWSIVYVAPGDRPFEVCAGPEGAEIIILNFPRAQV